MHPTDSPHVRHDDIVLAFMVYGLVLRGVVVVVAYIV